MVIAEFSADEEDDLRDDESDHFVDLCEKYGNAVVEDYYKVCDDKIKAENIERLKNAI